MEIFISVIAILLMPFFIVYTIYKSFQNQRRAKEVEQKNQDEQKSRKEAEQKRLDLRNAEKQNHLAFFRAKIFPTVASNKEIQQIWCCWTAQIHDTEEQLRQQVEAIYEAFPIYIDHSEFSSCFSDFCSVSRTYNTCLTNCTCDYFRKTRKPCKHMYRLFTMLEKHDEAESGVFIGKESIRKFNLLSDNQKDDFIFRIQYIGIHGSDSFKHSELQAEIDVGLFAESDDVDYTPVLNRMTKDEIILALTQSDIQGFRQSWSKVRIVAWVIENHNDYLKSKFENYVHISASKEIIFWGQSIRELKMSSTVVHPIFWEDMCRDTDVGEPVLLHHDN